MTPYTGKRGCIIYDDARRKWRVYVRVPGKRYHVGSRDTLEEAEAIKADAVNTLESGGEQALAAYVDSIRRPKNKPSTVAKGDRFGRLITVKRVPYRRSLRAWECRCDCGNTIVVKETSLTRELVKSCGCIRRESFIGVVEKAGFVDGTCLSVLKSNKVRKDSSTGERCIWRSSEDGMYHVVIHLQRVRHRCGKYETLEEAVKVRDKARARIHGEFLERYEKQPLNL